MFVKGISYQFWLKSGEGLAWFKLLDKRYWEVQILCAGWRRLYQKELKWAVKCFHLSILEKILKSLNLKYIGEKKS